MHIKFNILLFLPVISPNALDFLDFGTFWWFYLIAGFSFWGLGFNDLLQCMEKHEHSQREELVKTLVEMVQKGKKSSTGWKSGRIIFSKFPPPLFFLPETFYNLLLHLPKQGFLLPSRHGYNFQIMYNQRLELRRLKQTHENENPVYYQNELQKISSGTSERSRQLGCLSSWSQALGGLSIIHFIPMRDFLKGGGLDFKSPKFWPLPHFLLTPIGSTIYK